jgi:hypothetical protein
VNPFLEDVHRTTIRELDWYCNGQCCLIQLYSKGYHGKPVAVNIFLRVMLAQSLYERRHERDRANFCRTLRELREEWK